MCRLDCPGINNRALRRMHYVYNSLPALHASTIVVKPRLGLKAFPEILPKMPSLFFSNHHGCDRDRQARPAPLSANAYERVTFPHAPLTAAAEGAVSVPRPLMLRAAGNNLVLSLLC